MGEAAHALRHASTEAQHGTLLQALAPDPLGRGLEASWGPSSDSDPRSAAAQATQVPKDLSCAICRGCGRKSYYLADGNPVREHKIVHGAFYCSATCMEVDEPQLRAEVNFVTKGVWNPTRPPQGAPLAPGPLSASRLAPRPVLNRGNMILSFFI